MRTSTVVAVLLLSVLQFGLTPRADAQLDPLSLIEDRDWERRAQTGMKFLSVSLDSRAAAMGDAVTADEMGASSMFYNPAGIGRLPSGNFDAAFGRVQWIGEIDYSYAGAAFEPADGQYGVFGFNLVTVSYGTVQQTIRSGASEKGYEDLGTIEPSATSVGLSYGRVITDRFSVGGTGKFVSQSLGESILDLDGGSPTGEEFSENTFAFDFGVVYRTGFRSLRFAITARNFSNEITYAEESFELPLQLTMGLAADVLQLANTDSEMHSLQLAVDARRPRDFDEQLKMGLEYLFMNTVALRGGYTLPTDEEGINLGAGVQSNLNGFRVAADYSFSSFGLFNDVHRIALKFGL